MYIHGKIFKNDLMVINMDDNTKFARTALNRNEAGQFSGTDYGEKKLRSLRLSEEAWQLLEDKAIASGKTRTDVVEGLARGIGEEAMILSALRRYIDRVKSDYGTNPAQKGKEFSTHTRDWSQLMKFMKMVESEPWELGIGEE